MTCQIEIKGLKSQRNPIKILYGSNVIWTIAINEKLSSQQSTTPWIKANLDHDDIIKSKKMPGIAKEDVKITIDDDGVLTIKGEHKEEKDDDEQYWSSSSYGYYNTSLILPDDAKADDIKAELKDGVLTLIIPKTQQTSSFGTCLHTNFQLKCPIIE